MDPVTLIGLIAVITLFLFGVGLVWFGLTRQPSVALPDGADQLLEAVADGRLAPSQRVDEPRRAATPKQTTASRPAPISTPPASPPRADHDTPAVRLVPRAAPAQTAPSLVNAADRSVPTPRSPTPARQPKPSQAPPVPVASTSTATAGVVEASASTTSPRTDPRFDSLVDPQSSSEQKFFAQPAKYRRI
jgi:hypothetical protein